MQDKFQPIPARPHQLCWGDHAHLCMHVYCTLYMYNVHVMYMYMYMYDNISTSSLLPRYMYLHYIVQVHAHEYM